MAYSSARLTDRAKLWLKDILKADYAQTNESVIWEVSVAVFPDPSATDLTTGSLADPSALVPLPALVIYLEIPGAEPDTSMYIAPIIAPFQLTKATVERTVNGALKSMRESRENLVASS